MDYIREAAASPEAAVARRAMLGRNLKDFQAARRRGASVEEVTALALAEVREQLPRFLSDLRTTLLAEVLPSAPPRSARSSSSSSSACSSASSSSASAEPEVQAPPRQDYVSSDSTSTRHVVSVGPDAVSVAAAWQTSCGWKFGLSDLARAPDPGDADCRRCFPAVPAGVQRIVGRRRRLTQTPACLLRTSEQGASPAGWHP